MTASGSPRPVPADPVPNTVQRALDAVDRRLLAELAANGRLPNNVLAERLGIAPSTCLVRTQNLVKRGVIRGFRADVDYSKVGADLQAIISVRVRPSARAGLLELGRLLAREPGVLNVFFVAGVFDFLVHVVARDTEGLRHFVTRTLSSRTEIESTQTSLVFEHLPGEALPV